MAPPKGATAARGQEAGGVKGLESIFSGMKLEGATDEYHPRPDFGKAGKPIPVVANMYKVRFKNQGKEANSVNHYDVEINPVVKVANQKKPKQMLWEIWNQACAEATGEVKKVLDSAAYDSVKNMYTPYGLPTDGPNGNFEIIVALKEAGGDKAEKGDKGNDDRRRFKIVFSLANVIDLNTITEFCSKVPQTEKTKEIVLVAIQAMNVLLRQDPTNRFKAVGAQGRGFFSTEGAQPIPLGGVVYNGFMQSFRFTNSGSPAVQLDTAYSAFVQPGNLITVASGLLGAGGGGGARGGRGGPRGSPPDRGGRGGARGGRGGPPGAGGDGGGGDLNTLNPSQVGKLNRILRMAKFKVNHRPSERIFTLRGLTTRPCSELKFNLQGRDGAADRMVPVVQYMKEMYNYTVRKPNLPAVQYGKNFYLPMECAEIIDFNSIPFAQIASDQAAAMITIAAKAPPERRKTIEQWRGKLAYEKLPKIKAWGVEVVNEMMKVQARVLQPPNVVYGGNGRARVQFGGWNLKGTKFTRPGQPLKCWAVLSFDKFVGVPMLQGFVGQLVSVLNGAGCPVVNQQPPLSQMNPHPNGPCSGVKIAIQEACKAAYLQSKMDPQLLIIILPGKEAMMYQTIKQIAAETLQKPLVTQCLQAAKIKSDRGIDQYLGNVSMKIHAKLGGVTHEVPLPQIIDKKTMIIGADVTHPPARGGALPPSIAVTVAATNGDNVRFIPSIRLQEGRVEIISDLANMFHAQLLAFQRNSKALPEKIIMFRDGVSEGQYAHCVQEELKSMKDAAAKFPNYRPKFTFVVCAKRHNMRFFAEHQADIDRTGNLPPGTVVDNGVTHPFAFDFYLQAHAGLQGTARPTHYICVADENGFTADKLQGLCNALSYTYARATRSVSLIPVAYYADIIATKARDFVYGEDDSDAVSIATGSSGPEQRMTFNPTRLSSRFDNTSFNQVAWYM